MQTTRSTHLVKRTQTLREMRRLGYPSELRRKWWQATDYLRAQNIWVLDGAPAKWGDRLMVDAWRRA